MFCSGDDCPKCGNKDTFVADEWFEQDGDRVEHGIYFMCPMCDWISHTYIEHFKLDYTEELNE